MIQAPEPLAFEKLLSGSWALFRRNWIVSTPFVIAVLIIGALIGVFAVIATVVGLTAGIRQDHIEGGVIALLIVFYLVVIGAALVLSVWAYAATFGMADAMWERGTATFADGNAAFRARGGALVVACIGLIGLTFVALILALPTLFISLLALALFTMYVLPSVVSGRRAGFDAISESFRLVRYNFATSAITAVVLYAISYGISFLGLIPIIALDFSILPTSSDAMPQMPPIPLLVLAAGGYLLTLVASLAYAGFYAVAITGLYRSLIARGAPVPVAPAVEIAPPMAIEPPQV
jgi:hypothetical protein